MYTFSHQQVLSILFYRQDHTTHENSLLFMSTPTEEQHLSLHALVCLPAHSQGRDAGGVRTLVRPSQGPPAPLDTSALLQGPTCLVPFHGMSTSNHVGNQCTRSGWRDSILREQNLNSKPSTEYFYQCGLGVCHTLFLELNPQPMSCSASCHPTEAKSLP